MLINQVSGPEQLIEDPAPKNGRKQAPRQVNAAASITAKIERCNQEIQNKELHLAQLSIRGRYLETLSANTDKNEEELREDCIICMGSSEDAHGMLLDCGHFFCAVSGCFLRIRTELSLFYSPVSRLIEQAIIEAVHLAEERVSRNTSYD